MVRNLRPGQNWIPGVIIEILGPVTYLVDVNKGQVWKRHADQLKSMSEKPYMSEDLTSDGNADSAPQHEDVHARDSSPEPEEVYLPITPPDSEPAPPTEGLPPVTVDVPATTNPEVARRYPTRERHPPDRYT